MISSVETRTPAVHVPDRVRCHCSWSQQIGLGGVTLAVHADSLAHVTSQLPRGARGDQPTDRCILPTCSSQHKTTLVIPGGSCADSRFIIRSRIPHRGPTQNLGAIRIAYPPRILSSVKDAPFSPKTTPGIAQLHQRKAYYHTRYGMMHRT